MAQIAQFNRTCWLPSQHGQGTCKAGAVRARDTVKTSARLCGKSVDQSMIDLLTVPLTGAWKGRISIRPFSLVPTLSRCAAYSLLAAETNSNGTRSIR